MQRALTYGSYGAEDLLEWTEVLPDRNELGRFGLRVQVLAVSVNPVDWKILGGQQASLMNRRFPKFFGSDFVGLVLETGTRAQDLAGKYVIGMVNPLARGSARQILKVSALSAIALLPLTPGTPVEKVLPAAGLCAAGTTVLRTMSAGDLKILRGLREPPASKRRVLVVGANGGVGVLAVQLYRLAGWTVETCSSEQFHPQLSALGSAKTWPRNPSVVPAGENFDLVLDCPGILDAGNATRLLRRQGTWIPVQVENRKIPGLFLQSIVGVLGRKVRMVLAVPSRKIASLLAASFATGELRVPVAKVFPVTAAASAVRANIQGGAFGKQIIQLRESGDNL